MVFRCFAKWSVSILVILNVLNFQTSTSQSAQNTPSCVHKTPPQDPMFPMFPPAPPPMAQMFGAPAPPAPPPISIPFPGPMSMPMGIGVAFIEEPTKTTTTENNIAIAIPMPLPQIPIPGAMFPSQMLVPQAVQFAVPGEIPMQCMKDRRHPSCPPCPPCSCTPCTPSFFSYCSQCHQRCRCKNNKDTPIPLPLTPPKPLLGPAFPIPMPMAASYHGPNSEIMMVPYSPQSVRRHNYKRREYSCERYHSDDSSESSDTDSFSRERNRRGPYINIGNYGRRNRDGNRHIDDIYLKPELNYLSEDGEVKIKQHLNRGEALRLMAEDDYNKKRHKKSKAKH